MPYRIWDSADLLATSDRFRRDAAGTPAPGFRRDLPPKATFEDAALAGFAAIGDSIEGPPRRKWAALQAVWAEISEPHVKAEIPRHDKEAFDVDITQCRFADFFRALGEPELGALLICDADFDVVAAGNGDVSLTREQTIMNGAPSCTFRYKFTPK